MNVAVKFSEMEHAFSLGFGEEVSINDGYEKGYDAGKRAEWNAFWDACQVDGSTQSYVQRFAGRGWNDITFKPKYDIRIAYNGAVRTFAYCGVKDLRGILEKQGVELDTDEGGNMTNMFESASITRMPTLNISKQNSGYAIFVGCKSLQSIQKLIFKADGTTPIGSNMFQNCSALTEIEEIEGTIGKSLDMRWCEQLTHDTLIRISNALKDYSADTSGTIHKLIIGANQEKLTQDEIKKIEDKGWYLA